MNGNARPAASQQALLEQMVDLLTALPGALRQSVIDQQWARIPLYVLEQAFSVDLLAGVPLRADPQTSGLELIQTVVVSVPAAATGLVQLGSAMIPVGTGVTSFSTGLMLTSTDVRQLTITGTDGPASLILSGEQMARGAIVAG